ncbi:MAG: NADH-quinone oxidoreductase subunit C [Cyclobacteriaceae bacterium]|nr:NADH-quinone oxidoreductase subunit C [Cyclobacteriaceae bacterium]
MTFQEIKEILQQAFPAIPFGEDREATPAALVVDPAMLVEVCQWLKTNENTYFDMLSCLSGIDNGPDSGTMDVIYNLYSVPYDNSLMIKVSIDRQNPSIHSVAHIWKTANWHEREAFDLLGIYVEGHPDLRRILLPDDWQGFPLRKDYTEQEKYHGITVALGNQNDLSK